MKIEFLYFDGCPNHRATFDLLTEVLQERQMSVPIERICIRDDDDAVRNRFIGSPTIRVNISDIEPEIGDRPFAKACRLYVESGHFVGYPSKRMIEQALEQNQ